MIREIRLDDKEEWEILYRGYANFYKAEINDKILKTVWEWIHDKNHDVSGLVYEQYSKIIKDLENNFYMYFVHSYEFIPMDKKVISATTDYSSNIVCSVEKENIFGTQFHPEKSDKIGLKIINNFLNL